MKPLVTPLKAERMARNAKICRDFLMHRKRGGQKMKIYAFLGDVYGLKADQVRAIVKEGGCL